MQTLPQATQKAAPRFAMTYCSQCGCEMGPGSSGFSDCRDHAFAFNAARCDAAMHADKLVDGYGARNDARALSLQIQRNPRFWGSC
jgi:hypothetical protein